MLLLFVEVHAQKELKVFAQSFVALTLRIFLYYLFYLLNLEEITEAREEKKTVKYVNCNYFTTFSIKL